MSRGIKLCVVLSCGFAMMAAALPARADALSEKQKAQNKLLAYRAARADGMRKLAERIYGLSITSETKVKDFVTESDQIRTYVRAFLQGAREADKPKYMEDGTCEVPVEVTMAEVVVTLKKAYTEHYKKNKETDKLKITDFEQMEVVNNIKVLREVGMGAPRPELAEGVMSPVAEGSLESLTNLSGKAKEYWLAHVQPQGRLMAVRAARVDGMRRLAERINGVMLTSATSVKDFVAESDQINVDMRSFLQGAKETGIRYHDEELIVEVEMSVTLREVITGLKVWSEQHYKGNKVKIKDFEELTVKSQDKTIVETGMGVPPDKYLKDVTAADRAVVTLGTNAPEWSGRRLQAKGQAAVDAENANAAQAKLMAQRGAELDARRKLAEQINGLTITSSTTVRDFVAANDQIDTAMLTFQQGGSVVEGSQRFLEDGTCEVTVELDMRPLWNMVLYYQKKLSITIK